MDIQQILQESERRRDAIEAQTQVKKSLGKKVVIAILVMTLFIGCATLFAGYSLFRTIAGYEYQITTWNESNTEAMLLEAPQTQKKTDQILDIYDSIPNEEKGDGTGREYQAAYDGVIDDDFKAMQEVMLNLQNRNHMMASFIAAIDLENERMIYLVDSDPHPETFCSPGTWDMYSRNELEELVDGSMPTLTEKILGLTHPVQAFIKDDGKRGLRCTAGSELYHTERYTIMALMDNKLEHLNRIRMVFLSIYAAVLLLILVPLTFFFMRSLRRKVVEPINEMADAASKYSEERHSQKLDELGKHFSALDIHTGDEIERLSRTMKTMEEDITGYVQDLTQATAEKERISTELNVAATIQNEMLPNIFPPFPERTEFDIYASMTPAKEVGGDFYDFHMIDEDHIVVFIADVSGKGIPASLFMMASDIMINDYAPISDLSPAKILETVNEELCAREIAEMFVTVWLGILEISTGKLTAANAGHEYPLLQQEGGEFALFKDKHGFVLGGMSGVKYTEYEIQLEAGDRLFVYTDGVPEATDIHLEMFGVDRMVDVLNQNQNATPKEILTNMHIAVDQFVGEAEQFDDLTMLCLEYRGTVHSGTVHRA